MGQPNYENPSSWIWSLWCVLCSSSLFLTLLHMHVNLNSGWISVALIFKIYYYNTTKSVISKQYFYKYYPCFSSGIWGLSWNLFTSDARDFQIQFSLMLWFDVASFNEHAVLSYAIDWLFSKTWHWNSVLCTACLTNLTAWAAWSNLEGHCLL